MNSKKSKRAVAEIEPISIKADDYNYVADRAQLGTIKLLESSYKVDPSFQAPTEKSRMIFNREMITCHVPEERDVAAGVFEYEAVVKRSRHTLFRCSATYVVVYDIPEDGDVDAAKAFCERVGMFAAFPYFRALAAHLAWASEVEIPPLPVITTPPRKSVDQHDGDSAKSE